MQANSIADLLTNKLKSLKFAILFLDCVETAHERWLFSLICRIAVQVHATTETDMAILPYTIFLASPVRYSFARMTRPFLPELVDFQIN